jgi:hypothetical protein
MQTLDCGLEYDNILNDSPKIERETLFKEVLMFKTYDNAPIAKEKLNTTKEIKHSCPNFPKWEIFKNPASGTNKIRLKLRKFERSKTFTSYLKSKLSSESLKWQEKKIREKTEMENYGKELVKDMSTILNINNQDVGIIRSNLNSIRKIESQLSLTKKIITLEEKVEEKKLNMNLIKINNIDQKDDPKLSDDEFTETIHTRYVINQNNLFRKIWDFIIFFVTLYTLLFTPVQLAFDSYTNFTNFLEILVEILCILDIIFNFFTTFFDNEENHITNLSEIMCSYFFSRFFNDLISSFPIVIIYHFNLLSKNGKNYLPLNFCCLKWIKLLQIMKIFRHETTGRYLKNFNLLNGSTINRIIKFCFIFMILIHFSSCFFIFLTFYSEGSNNWINKSGVYDINLDIYVASLYFNLATIVSVGYGDITPVNIFERIWVIFFMMVGSMLYSYSISSLSTIFLESNKYYSEYKKKLEILNSINDEFHISITLFQKLKQIIKQECHNKEQERYEFLESLPSNIKNELMTLMFESSIAQNEFFKNQNKNFILFVLPFLRFHRFYKNDVLISVGDVTDEMYFVIKGNLGLNMGNNFGCAEISHINSKNYFGDLLLQLNEVSPYELKCKSKYADLLVLKKSDYLKIKNKFYSEIYSILNKSLKELEIADQKKLLVSKITNLFPKINVATKKLSKINKVFLEEEFIESYGEGENIEKINESNFKEEQSQSKKNSQMPEGKKTHDVSFEKEIFYQTLKSMISILII